MPPRTTQASTGGRRSTRIAAQPKEEVKEKPATKKRATREDKDEASTTKKKAKTNEEVAGGEGEAAGAEAGEAEKLAPIDVGDSLPSLTLKDEKNEDIQIADLASEGGVVLFLVPKADTPGCTTQACGFRDIYPDFTSVGFKVYCLSADSPTSQTKWQTKKELPYPLISDPKRVLITALGAGDGGKTKRSHFVFDKGGKLLDKRIPVKPADSPKLALEFIKSIE